MGVKEVKELKEVQEKINSLARQLSDYTEICHDKSLDNSEGIFDVASLVDENSQAIMELADIIAEMEG